MFDGSSVNARLESFTPEGMPVLIAEQNGVRIDNNRCFRFGNLGPAIRQDMIILKNGSRLSGFIESITEEQIAITSRLFDLTELPVTQVRGVVFRQPANAVARQKTIDQILFGPSDETLAVLVNDDIANGQLAKPDRSGLLRLTIKELSRSIAFEELAYVRFASADKHSVESVAPNSQIGLEDGTRLIYRKLIVTDDDLRFVVNDQLELSAAKSVRKKPFTNRICFYQPALPQVRILSLETPLKVIDGQTDNQTPTRMNRSTIAGPLLSQGREYALGIGTHAESQVVFSVGKDDKVFRCKIALDDSANSLANAICRIVLLGKDNQWKAVRDPARLSHKDPSHSVEVNVEGYRAIGLVTSKGLHGTTGDRVNWLDARMHQ